MPAFVDILLWNVLYHGSTIRMGMGNKSLTWTVMQPNTLSSPLKHQSSVGTKATWATETDGASTSCLEESYGSEPLQLSLEH